VYSLSLSVATPSVGVFFSIRQLEFHRIIILTRFVTCYFCFVFLKRYLLLLFVVGSAFLFFVAPSLAVFYVASKFNQDVSKWNTGAVTNMWASKCTLSPSLATPSAVVFFNIRQLEFHRITILTRFVIFVFLKRYLFLVVCGGLVFLFFVAPSLAVFRGATVFNADVSEWNTGAVTTMQSSKCTLSPSLWPRLPLS
jgi:surface protein